MRVPTGSSRASKYRALNPAADFLSDLSHNPRSNSALSAAGVQRRYRRDILLYSRRVCEVEEALNTGARTLEIVSLHAAMKSFQRTPEISPFASSVLALDPSRTVARPS